MNEQAQQSKITVTVGNAPVGTKAPASNGGFWIREEQGWRWCTGSVFRQPGGDWTGVLIMPEVEEPRRVVSVVIDGNEVAFTQRVDSGLVIYTNGKTHLRCDTSGEWRCWVEDAMSTPGGALTAQEAVDELAACCEPWKRVNFELLRLSGDPRLSVEFQLRAQEEIKPERTRTLSVEGKRLAEAVAAAWGRAAELAETWERHHGRPSQLIVNATRDSDAVPSLGAEFFRDPIVTRPGESLVEKVAAERGGDDGET